MGVPFRQTDVLHSGFSYDLQWKNLYHGLTKPNTGDLLFVVRMVK